MTRKITKDEIKEAKRNWEKKVAENNEIHAKQSQSEFDLLDLSKIKFLNEVIHDNTAIEVKCSPNIQINKHTRFVLKVKQTSPEQEFIVYLSVMTNTGSQKWLGFGTPLDLKNVYSSERVFRIGKPGEKVYTTVEFIKERLNESGLIFDGEPSYIDIVRLWGWHYNKKAIEFKFAFIE